MSARVRVTVEVVTGALITYDDTGAQVILSSHWSDMSILSCDWSDVPPPAAGAPQAGRHLQQQDRGLLRPQGGQEGQGREEAGD